MRNYWICTANCAEVWLGWLSKVLPLCLGAVCAASSGKLSWMIWKHSTIWMPVAWYMFCCSSLKSYSSAEKSCHPKQLVYLTWESYQCPRPCFVVAATSWPALSACLGVPRSPGRGLGVMLDCSSIYSLQVVGQRLGGHNLDGSDASQIGGLLLKSWHHQGSTTMVKSKTKS